MHKFIAASMTCLVWAMSIDSAAADGMHRSSIKNTGLYGATCFLMRRSPILELGSTAAMRTEVEQRYERSVEVAFARSTIYSRRAAFPWSQEAKAACGKAIGYFNGREVNEDMINKCDCYHGRMVAHLR